MYIFRARFFTKHYIKDYARRVNAAKNYALNMKMNFIKHNEYMKFSDSVQNALLQDYNLKGGYYSKTKVRRRCRMTYRSRGVKRVFGLSRIALAQLIDYENKDKGIRKSLMTGFKKI